MRRTGCECRAGPLQASERPLGGLGAQGRGGSDMNGQILRLGGDEHDIVQLLLPWYDSGHLDASETARVQAHLGSCARCQADIAWQRRVRELTTADEAQAHGKTHDVDQGWAALRAQVLAQQASPS